MTELAADEARAARRAAGRERYERNFTDAAMASAYRDLYEAVLANRGKA